MLIILEQLLDLLQVELKHSVVGQAIVVLDLVVMLKVVQLLIQRLHGMAHLQTTCLG